MGSRKLWEVIGLAAGFILIDYGFNVIAVGLHGAREFTSQFVGLNLIVGGSVVVFGSLYYLLKPAVKQAAVVPTPVAGAPNVGVEVIVTEERESGPKIGFYKTIECIGYFFTFLGLISAADLVLQAFIPVLYNELRFWVEVLLVTFGVLSYAIFGSIGHLGAQEERVLEPTAPVRAPAPPQVSTMPPATAVAAYPDQIVVRFGEFAKSEAGEYECHLSENVYDMLRIEPVGITVWREDRRGLRSIYMAGPYELRWKLLEDYANRGEEVRIGSLILPPETLRELLGSQIRVQEQGSAA